MIRIGCHLSPSKGFVRMGQDALSIGANTFQFFLRNPRGSKAKDLDKEDAPALMALLREKDMLPIVAHAPYTLNPCAAEARVQEFAAMVSMRTVVGVSGCNRVLSRAAVFSMPASTPCPTWLPGWKL